MTGAEDDGGLSLLDLYGLACLERLGSISATGPAKCNFYTSQSFVPTMVFISASPLVSGLTTSADTVLGIFTTSRCSRAATGPG
jgi:hypothetical protein